MSSQVSPPPSPYLEARVANLEENLGDVRGDVDAIKEWCHQLSSTIEEIKKVEGWPSVISSQYQEPTPSCLHALEFSQELEELTREVHKSVDGADVDKVTTPKANGSVPPHLRAAANGAASKLIPPHLRGKAASG
jgi:hypothetical protein